MSLPNVNATRNVNATDAKLGMVGLRYQLIKPCPAVSTFGKLHENIVRTLVIPKDELSTVVDGPFVLDIARVFCFSCSAGQSETEDAEDCSVKRPEFVAGVTMEKQRSTEHPSHPVSQQMVRDKIIAHLQDAWKFLHNVQFQIEHSPDPWRSWVRDSVIENLSRAQAMLADTTTLFLTGASALSRDETEASHTA
ncbi:MAG: hypothetical protein DMG59_29220 [Acidobacteria bacterium]|nr:MAG: hypothetical protein DMG59_29220 [Acidobacteriota bacterium]